ncbi:MAG: hypothetical protein P4L22_03415 [Candidatus Babeliales bacterium]|nr:hypothetical protein [Candidatus Babeliales bacterium]
MQIRKLFFLILSLSAYINGDCCSSNNNCNSATSSISKSCSGSSSSSDCCDAKTNIEDCFFKNCVSCKSCDIERRCCGDNGNFYGKTFFSQRPQDSNAARRILSSGTNGYDIRAEDSCFNDCNARGVVTLEYQQSFHDKKLAQWFSFNCDDCNCMTVGVPGNNQTYDINAIELGLSTTNNAPGAIGDICLNPKIRNIIADLDFKFDLNDCVCNSWARINMVIANCKTEMRLSGDTTGNIATTIPAGVVSSAAVEVPFNSVLEAFEAQSAFGEVPVLKFGRFANCVKSKTGVAGLHLDLGYDFVRCERGHIGASAHIVFPTGTRPKGVFLLEPVIGANKSWQLGATVNASYDLYKGCDDGRITLFFDSVITHLFKSRQYRPFQLKNGPGSEFLILKTFDCTGQAIGLERAANILHGETKIGNDIMFDGALMFQFAYCNFFGDLGYNFWYRSKDKRANTVCFSGFAENKYGIAPADPIIAGNFPFCTPTTIDICSTANCSTCAPNNSTAPTTTISTPGPINADPVFIGIGDIDFSSALNPSAISNKVFAALGYQFECKYPMYVSLGGEVEFGQDNRAINQWGVLGQFGISF